MKNRPEDKIDFRTRAWNRKPAILAIDARGVLRPRSLASPRSRRPKATTSETCSRRGPESLRVRTSLRAKMKRRFFCHSSQHPVKSALFSGDSIPVPVRSQLRLHRRIRWGARLLLRLRRSQHRRREGAAAPRSAAVMGRTFCRLCRFARRRRCPDVSSASSRATDGGELRRPASRLTQERGYKGQLLRAFCPTATF
jgi:hypothetical protein